MRINPPPQRARGELWLGIFFITLAILVYASAFWASTSPFFISGLLLMAVAIFVMVRVITPAPLLSSLGFLAIGGLTLYHGLGSFSVLALGLDRIANVFGYANTSDFHIATFISGVGILLFASGYGLAFLSFTRRHSYPYARDRSSWIDQIDVRILVIWTALIALHSSGVFGKIIDPYWDNALFYSMMPPVFVLFGIKCLDYQRRKHSLAPLLLIYLAVVGGLYLFFSSARLSVAVVTVSVVFLSTKWNIYQWKTKLLAILSVILAISFLLVALVGDKVGQTTLIAGDFSERLNVYTDLGQEDIARLGQARLEQDFGLRYSANLYLAGLYRDISFVGNEYYFDHLLVPLYLIIPSAIWPAKLQLPVHDRDVKASLSWKYHMFDTDFVPSILSIFFGIGGMPPLIIGMLVLGLVVAFFDRKLAFCNSRICGIIAVCLAVALSSTEHEITVWALSFRSALILIAVFGIVDIFRLKREAASQSATNLAVHHD